MSKRTMEILAHLALRRPLNVLSQLCDEQKQISTGRLYAYLEQAGDTMAGYAVDLRREHDTLAQRCLELEVAAKYSERVDATPESLRETVLYDTLRERDTLLAEVERLRALLKQSAALLPRDYQDEEALARQIDKEIAAWNAHTTGDTPEA